jgi:hypothetical protein
MSRAAVLFSVERHGPLAVLTAQARDSRSGLDCLKVKRAIDPGADAWTIVTTCYVLAAELACAEARMAVWRSRSRAAVAKLAHP